LATLYATVADLQQTLDGTDSGTGTAAQLTPAQLTLALTSASNRISVYAGGVYDSSTPQAIPPPVFHDLCLDLAAFFATTTYMKSKVIGATHPVFLRYKDAQQMLQDARDGKLRLDIYPPGSAAEATPVIINRIPRIFSGNDSNTRLDPVSGFLEPSTPAGTFDSHGLLDGLDFGSVYQG
jgi:phage gp36-like protein